MGNSLAGKKKTIKVMKVDGTVYKLKPPAQARSFLRDKPGHNLLEPDEVKRLGLRAKPLEPDAPLKPGKLYFLVEIPRLARTPRRTWSGQLHQTPGSGGARERLEGLRVTRRSVSDLSLSAKSPAEHGVVEEITKDGVVRVRMKLPKAQVEKLMMESKDQAEAAEKLMELCPTPPRTPMSRSAQPTPPMPIWKQRTPELTLPAVKASRTEKRIIKFLAMPDEIIV